MSRTCDPEEILQQLMQNLNLDKTCLKEPTPETTTMIRCFVAQAKISNRIDVVKDLRDIVPAGTSGEFTWSSIQHLVEICRLVYTSHLCLVTGVVASGCRRGGGGGGLMDIIYTQVNSDFTD